MTCPFCDDPSEHLGYHLGKDYYRCWRCGWHSVLDVFIKLLNMGQGEVYSILKQYGGEHAPYAPPPSKVGEKPFQFPIGTGPLRESHRKYLERRNFDPDKLIQEWGLMGTGVVGVLDEDDYKHRIIVPIYWQGVLVSFQSRALSKKDERRYKACPKPREMIHHKDIVYWRGRRNVGICVEGVTDVWRLGKDAFAVFGIGYTATQVQCIASTFKSVIILFDQEPQAQEQARRLTKELSFRGVSARQEVINALDPASMKQTDADYLIKQLIGG